MTKAELLATLNGLVDCKDPEDGHAEADAALIEFINDPEIEAAYGEVFKWYA